MKDLRIRLCLEIMHFSLYRTPWTLCALQWTPFYIQQTLRAMFIHTPVLILGRVTCVIPPIFSIWRKKKICGAIPNAFKVIAAQKIEMNAACFHLVQGFLLVKSCKWSENWPIRCLVRTGNSHWNASYRWHQLLTRDLIGQFSEHLQLLTNRNACTKWKHAGKGEGYLLASTLTFQENDIKWL